MSAIILDGKKRAEEIKIRIKEEVGKLKASYGVPKLVALQVKDDTAFSVYANAQRKLAEDIGIEYELIKLENDISQNGLIQRIESLNSDDSVAGIMIQAPLPKDFDYTKVISSISSFKDVEKFHTTATAIMELIDQSGIDLRGKEAVVVGHSSIVGKPIAMLLLDELATVTVCHIATWEKGKLEEHVSRAEILVVAVGKESLIKGNWIKKGAVVIDAGIKSIKGRVVGDVEFDEAKKRASYITPVPGGVGPITTVMLMQNCLKLFKQQRGIK